MEKEELQIKELVALRGHYFSAVLLISIGIAGLFFVEISYLKMIFLVLIGAYFDIVFLSKFFDADDKIKTIAGRR